MNRSGVIIIIILIILIILGVFIFAGNNKPVAPITNTVTQPTDTTNASSTPQTATTTNATSSASAGVSAGVTAGTAETKSFTVTGQNFSFTPKTMSVKKGDKVQITFVNAEGHHDINIDEFNVHSGIINGGQQKVVTFTADKTGSFQYYCSVGSHRAMGMWGTLTVTE